MTASRSRNRLADVSATAQCARLLERLKVGSINSFEIVSELNICRPGARIADLRADGHPIPRQRQQRSASASTTVSTT